MNSPAAFYLALFRSFRRLPCVFPMLLALLVLAPVARPQAAPAGAPPASDDTVVLTVGDQQITRAEFEDIISTLNEQQRASVQSPEARRSLAEQISELKLMAQEARRRGIDTDPATQTRIEMQADRVLASELYQAFIKGPMDEATLRAYYNEHLEEWEEADGRHILVRFQGSQVPLREGQEDLTEPQALSKIQALRTQIVGGADFSDVAKESSDDRGSGENGGQLGKFGRGQMIEEFDETAFSAPLGEVSQPIRTAYGYHLIVIDERSARAFEDVRADIEGRIAPEIGVKAIEDLKAANPVVYDETYFGPAPE